MGAHPTSQPISLFRPSTISNSLPKTPTTSLRSSPSTITSSLSTPHRISSFIVSPSSTSPRHVSPSVVTSSSSTPRYPAPVTRTNTSDPHLSNVPDTVRQMGGSQDIAVLSDSLVENMLKRYVVPSEIPGVRYVLFYSFYLNSFSDFLYRASNLLIPLFEYSGPQFRPENGHVLEASFMLIPKMFTSDQNMSQDQKFKCDPIFFIILFIIYLFFRFWLNIINFVQHKMFINLARHSLADVYKHQAANTNAYFYVRYQDSPNLPMRTHPAVCVALTSACRDSHIVIGEGQLGQKIYTGLPLSFDLQRTHLAVKQVYGGNDLYGAVRHIAFDYTTKVMNSKGEFISYLFVLFCYLIDVSYLRCDYESIICAY